MRIKTNYLLVAGFFTMIIFGCKKWDSEAVTNQDLNQTLVDATAGDPALSKFSEYINKSGLASLLQSSKDYTVWAPTNDALATLDPAIVADSATLRKFVMNHISNQNYFTKDVQGSTRVPMLNGKYNNFFPDKFEDASITAADKFVRNGVLHVINKSILVLPNLWDYINSSTATYTQNSFISALNFPVFDPALATIDSISSTTGLPIYHPGTGIVIKNTFNEKLFDSRKEEKQYTYFVIANAGFTLKTDSLKPYFKAGTTAITDSLCRWNIVKDLVFDTLYPTAVSIPAVLVSKSGITVPINKALIIDSKKLSNGMVYVLSGSSVSTASKFLESIIQGENPSGFQSDKTSNTNYRVRQNPVTLQNYSDIMITGHGVTDYYAFYRLNEMPTLKYNVYARAINDFQTQVVYQSINTYFMSGPTTFTQIPAVPVFIPTAPRTPAQLWYPVPSIRGGVAPLPAYYTFTAPSFNAVSSSIDAPFNELFLGSFTSNLYGTLEVRLQSGAPPSTVNLPSLPVFGATGVGPMVLDYLRIVPVP